MKRIGIIAAIVAMVGAAWWMIGALQQESAPESGADLANGTDSVLSPTPRGRWIIAGGGPFPDSNQVSIEADIALARSVAGESARVLFAGGPETQAVQVTANNPPPRDLRAKLADLISPRAGRDAGWRPTRLAPEGPATWSELTNVLREELGAGGEVVIYLAGHGEPGMTPIENGLSTWGGKRLLVTDLAALLDTAPNASAQVVMTSCYSGGFAEIVFAGADAAAGAANTTRCGLFATSWDLESSGCDPNPDRRAHEGYGVHFLHALMGQDRDGKPLPGADLDLDANGTISMLEAHTRARIAGKGVDVPTTTSERWLNSVAPMTGPSMPYRWPEEEAVVRALEVHLKVSGFEPAAAEWELLESKLLTATEASTLAAEKEIAAATHVIAQLLSRWPVLDDPWHPQFEQTLKTEGPAIEAFLDESEDYASYLVARGEVDRLATTVDELQLKQAPWERLVRAYDNLDLAGRLQAEGGPNLETFESILGCERR